MTKGGALPSQLPWGGGRRAFGPSLVMPDTISGLVVWIEGDDLTGSNGDAITTWANRVAGATVGQSNATYKPDLKISGVARYAHTPNAGAQIATLDAASIASVNTNAMSLYIVGKTTGAGAVRGFMVQPGAYPNGNTAIQAQGQFMAWDQFGNWSSGLTIPSAADGIMALVIDGAGTRTAAGIGVYMYVNGQSSFRSRNANSVAPTSYAFTAASLGAVAAGSNATKWTGDFRAVLLFNRVLTPAEHIVVMNYLKAVYSLVPTTPSLLTVYEGDSMILGYITGVDGQGLSDRIINAKGCDGYNFAVTNSYVAATATNITNRAAQVDYTLTQSHANKVLVLWCVSNEINGGFTGAQSYANLKTYIDARVTAGWTRSKIVVVNCLPRGASGTFETERLAYNALLATKAGVDFGAVADVAGNATIGAAGAQNDTNYYNVDKIHLLDAGYAIAAPIVQAAIESV